MKLFKAILLLALSAASFARADRDLYPHAFYVCKNSEVDRVIIAPGKGKEKGRAIFYYNLWKNILTISGSDVLSDDDGSLEESFAYFSFYEGREIFKIIQLRNGQLIGRLEASFNNPEVLINYSSCVWNKGQ